MAATLPTPRRPRFLADAPTPSGVQPAAFARDGAATPSPAERSEPARLPERPAPVAAPPPPPQPAAIVRDEPAAPAPPEPTRLPERPAPIASPPPQQPAPPTANLEQVAAAVESLRQLGAKLAEQARSDALEIAFHIARRILETELTSSPQPLFALVRSAVRRVGEAREIAVRLSPADAALVESQPRGDLGLSMAKVTLVPDPTLERGDCVVESDLGTVDGRLATRAGELRRSLDEALAGDAA